MHELPLAPIDRLIRKSGAERVSEDASEAMAAIIADFVEDLSTQAYKLAKHAGRKTITAEDIQLAAKEF
jgi:histone H3/H4